MKWESPFTRLKNVGKPNNRPPRSMVLEPTHFWEVIEVTGGFFLCFRVWHINPAHFCCLTIRRPFSMRYLSIGIDEPPAALAATSCHPGDDPVIRIARVISNQLNTAWTLSRAVPRSGRRSPHLRLVGGYPQQS